VGLVAGLEGGGPVGFIEFLIAREYLSRLPGILEGAKSSIQVVQFVMQLRGKSARMASRELGIKLSAKAAEGVAVEVILNSAGGGWRAPALNRQATEWLNERGIEVRTLGPNTTCHAKLVIIDREVAVVGSHNWTPYALRDNFEVSVLIRDAGSVGRLAQHFDQLWQASPLFTV
jgi:phosphatidylserine/phosphatidylglycerophosphate/cardiolipin synthase-like enzyme